MQFDTLPAFLESGILAKTKGPIAMIFVEDQIEIDNTLTHHLNLDFALVVMFAPPMVQLPPTLAARVQHVHWDTSVPGHLMAAVNPVIAAAPEGTWMYYCYNAEYLFYPFIETRSVRELLAFHTEERRTSMLSYVIDLYAPDLHKNPNGVNRDEAMLDRAGYYALQRTDPQNGYAPKDRQNDFYGGLRWRFEEHISWEQRRIDRISLFRTTPGLTLLSGHVFNIEEYNTYACPWHNNLTAAIMSFRVTKGLKFNPGSCFDIKDFRWYNSVPFDWSSQQLMTLGLIEPGQWF